MRQIDWEEEEISNVLLIGRTKTIELKGKDTKSVAERIKDQGVSALRKQSKKGIDQYHGEKYISFYEKIKDSVKQLCLFTTQLSYSIILEQQKNNTEIIFIPKNLISSQLQEIWHDIYYKRNYQYIIYYKGIRYDGYQYEEILHLIADFISHDDGELLKKDGNQKKLVK